MYKQRIFGFSALDRNKVDSRSADFRLRLAVDRDLGLESSDIVRAEFTAEETRFENAGSVEHSRKLFLVISAGIELQARIESAEILLPPDMVPVGVSNQNGCQFRQLGGVRSKRFVGRSCGIRPGASINTDQFAPVLRNHEVVFSEFVAGQRVYFARHNFDNSLW